MPQLPSNITVNLDSATAQRIAEQYIHYKYFECFACLGLFVFLFVGVPIIALLFFRFISRNRKPGNLV